MRESRRCFSLVDFICMDDKINNKYTLSWKCKQREDIYNNFKMGERSANWTADERKRLKCSSVITDKKKNEKWEEIGVVVSAVGVANRAGTQ